MKAMLFAAGLGTRLKPITDSIPKALLPIAGKTLLEWQIDKLRSAGITDIVINIHHFGQQIIDFCAEHDNFGCHIAFSDERAELLETGGGLKNASPLLGGGQGEAPILVLNVDVLSNIDLKAFIESYTPDCLATLVVSHRDTQRYFVFNNGQNLIGWTNIATGEKRGPYATSPDAQPTTPCPSTGKGEGGKGLLAFSGMQLVSPRIFELMADYPAKFSITNFYIDQCAAHPIRAYIPSNYRMMDIGKIDHLHEAELFAQTL